MRPALLSIALVAASCGQAKHVTDRRTATEAELSAKRSSCSFTSGAMPADTLGVEYPIGDEIPLKHIIVIMQENRSFDHYLGQMVNRGLYQSGDFSVGGSGFAHADQMDGPPAGWSNPDGMGGTVTPHPDTQHCFGVGHSWDDMHDYYDDGKLDHFVTRNNPGGDRVFTYIDDHDIPFYWALANTFAVGDRNFSSVMTSTWPNRMFLMAGTSFGIGDNSPTNDTKAAPLPQIFAELEAAGHTWKDYTDGPHQVLFFPYFGFREESLASYGNVFCDLFSDIASNQLADVSFVMGDETTETSDEGPSALPGIGGLLVEKIVRALWASDAWKDTAVFITYDENGGTADHVPPPAACPPDGNSPHTGAGQPLSGAFDRLGFRVPLIVVSPYAKAHYVSHQVYDHTSLTRFIQAKFGLPALTARDANATPPFDMFDFDKPAFKKPPTIDATTVVDPAVLASCHQSLAPIGCVP